MAEFTRERFEEVLGVRGVPWERRDVWEGMFYPYRQGARAEEFRNVLFSGKAHDLTEEQVSRALELCEERAARAPGIMMRRHALPEADQFIFSEMRPDRPILTGRPKVRSHRSMKRRELAGHVARSKTTWDDIKIGCTPEELRRFRGLPGWGVTKGEDHFGTDPGRSVVHVHLSVPKALFPRNQKEIVPAEHVHSEHPEWDLNRHLYEEHGWPVYEYAKDAPELGELGRDERAIAKFSRRAGMGRIVNLQGGRLVRTVTYRDRPSDTETHEHKVRVDKTFYARRLSSHPVGFARIAGAERVCIAMESLIKEASLVVVGEATMSAPSVTLWRASELEDVTREHLAGKLVLVIPDSDWDPAVRKHHDDAVIRQAILFREELRRYGARAYIAAPLHPKQCAKGCKRHGVDDHLAHGVTGRRRGTVDQLVWVDVEAAPKGTLEAWYEASEVRTPAGKRIKVTRVRGRDEVVLKWLSLVAAPFDGSTRIAVRKLAEYLRRDLITEPGADPEGAAVERTLNALEDMDAAGVLSGYDELKHRVDYHIGKTEEWRGTLTIKVKELRATFDTSQTVADLMNRPKVLNMTGHHLQVPDGAVYVGRRVRGLGASPFANPFKVEDHGREGAVEEYRRWLLAQPELVETARKELAGKDLACWCAPEPCHGDVLLEIANS